MLNRAAALSYDASQSQSGLRGVRRNEARPARATLVLLTGTDAGRAYELDAESSILGRDATADVQVEHSTVSRHHARVWRMEDGRYFVEDLGSTNGTAIGSRCMQRSELKANDLLQLGPHIQLRFELVEEDEEDA